ncbi:MAG: EF-hand domain-containing protein [Rhodobacteraceae bacterium]|nr:EF-hand domain-containing protein [Paracoccaceae bacterium]
MYKPVALALFLAAAPAFSQTPAKMFLENWDLDGDGTVTMAEAKEKRADIFYTFDADENGTLDAEEYAVFDEARANDMEQMGMGKGGKGKGAQAAQGMRREFTDLDGNGSVTRDEFLDSLADWFSRIDRNGDGMVNGDDFQR